MVPLFLVASAITGAFHAFIWLSEGILLSRYPDDVRNKYIGIFFGILCSNIIFGNLISLIVLLTGVDIQQMIWVLMSITFVGAVLSIFILPFSCSELCYVRSKDTNHHTNILDSIKRVFVIVAENKGYLLMPLMILQTFDVNVSIQILSKQIIVNAHGSPSVGVYTAAMYMVYGFSALVSSFFLGRLFDKFGWKFVLISYAVLQAVSLTGIMLISKLSSDGPLGLWITISFVKGITDNAIVVMINISISRVYQERSDLMLAFYRFTFAIFYVISSVMVGYVSYEWILLVDGILIIVAIISYSFFHIDNIEEQFNKSSVDLTVLAARVNRVNQVHHANLATIV
jgi:MFS family permease